MTTHNSFIEKSKQFNWWNQPIIIFLFILIVWNMMRMYLRKRNSNKSCFVSPIFGRQNINRRHAQISPFTILARFLFFLSTCSILFNYTRRNYFSQSSFARYFVQNKYQYTNCVRRNSWQHNVRVFKSIKGCHQRTNPTFLWVHVQTCISLGGDHALKMLVFPVACCRPCISLRIAENRCIFQVQQVFNCSSMSALKCNENKSFFQFHFPPPSSFCHFYEP